jgi:hypothetical protein
MADNIIRDGKAEAEPPEKPQKHSGKKMGTFLAPSDDEVEGDCQSEGSAAVFLLSFIHWMMQAFCFLMDPLP